MVEERLEGSNRSTRATVRFSLRSERNAQSCGRSGLCHSAERDARPSRQMDEANQRSHTSWTHPGACGSAGKRSRWYLAQGNPAFSWLGSVSKESKPTQAWMPVPHYFRTDTAFRVAFAVDRLPTGWLPPFARSRLTPDN